MSGHYQSFTFGVIAFFTLTCTNAADSPSKPAPAPSARTATYPIANLPSAHSFALQPPGGSQEKRGLVWLDDHQVMFVGVVRGTPESKGLYIWDVTAKTVRQYSSHTDFCYADDYIMAREFHPDKAEQRFRPIRYGRLGQEKDDACDISTGKGCERLFNMSCTPAEYRGRPTIGKDSAYTVELRNGDGVIVDPVSSIRVLDRIPKGIPEQRKFFSRPLLLVNKRFPDGKPLPIMALEEITTSGAAYSQFAKRYVFVTQRPTDGLPGYTTSIWPQGRSQPVYLMSPDGEVKSVEVPSRRDWYKIYAALLASPGLVFLGNGGAANAWGGLFLYDNLEIWPLDRGRVETFAVSPDGCRVAYSISNDDFSKTPLDKMTARVKSIEFCKGKK